MNILKKLLRKIKKTTRKLKKTVPIYIPVYHSNLLTDRCAFVTGGTRGIGFEIAKSFLTSGAKVVITGRSDIGVKKAVKLLLENKDFNDRVFGIAMDNSEPALFKEKFFMAVQLCGKIDILVNNAGVNNGGNIGFFDEKRFTETLAINLMAPALLSEVVAQYMKEKNIQGNVLNVCSSSSLRPATSPYTMSKWGLRGFTLGLAKTLMPYGIVVNGVAPGPTSTEMLVKDGYDGVELAGNPTGRYATAAEIANMATILVSKIGRMVVGDVLYMTGGAGLITFDDMSYRF